ncbi:MAG: hypothetical protein WBL05_10725, partial [Brooklawnia sp.]|uniref:hypothetical protein n=1 Tax=Brooklawnia sp. TaxID=2699740 RepID=UPI003C76B09C
VQDTVVIKRALMVWPTALVTEPVAVRERLAEEARSEVPQAIREALPDDLLGARPGQLDNGQLDEVVEAEV